MALPHIVHDIEDTLSLPPEVISIIDHFLTPLTPDFANVAEGSLSFGSFDIYREALKSPLLSLDVDNTRWMKQKPVTRVIDTSLTFVRTLRVVSSPDHLRHFGSSPIYRTWASFIGILGFTSSDDAVVISDMPFLLPRTVGSMQVEPTVFEGSASVLIAWAVIPKEKAQADVQVNERQHLEGLEEEGDVTMEVDSQCGSNPKQQVDQNVESMMEDHELGPVLNIDTLKSDQHEADNSDDSSEIYTSIEAPCDGHIVPGTGRHINCVLPTLCVANKNNIRPLVTSIAYQRYIWGIYLPTIGIELDGGGTTARVVIGWIDEEIPQTIERLPYVHLTFSSDIQTPHPSKGVYDLLDPASTLLFAQFVLWNEEHLSRISHHIKNKALTQDLCWRLDHQQFNNSTTNPHSEIASQDWRERIEAWRLSAISDLADDSCHLPLSVRDQMNNMSEKPELRFSTRLQQQRRQQGDNAKPERKPVKKSSSKPKHSSKGKSKAVEVVSADYAISAKDTGTSASAFGALHPPNAITTASPSTDLWLWERLTVRIARIPIQTSHSDLQLQINVMIGDYDKIMKMVVPKEWEELDCMPKCDQLALAYRTELHKQMAEHSLEYPATVVAPSDDGLESALRLFANQPSTLYNSIMEAQRYHKQESIRIKVPEAEKRRVWDNILHTYASSSDIPGLPSFHQEKTVHCPKNDFIGNPSQYPIKWKADVQSALAVLQNAESILRPISNEVRSIVEKLAKDANEIRNFFDHNSPKIPLDQREEPSSAKADGILTITVHPINSTLQSTTTVPADHRTTGSSSVTAHSVSLKGEIVHLFETGIYWKEKEPTSYVTSPSGSATQSHTLPGKPDPISHAEGTPLETSSHISCPRCPAVTEHPSSGTHTCHQVNPITKRPNASLCVPFFFTEYKKDDKSDIQAFNQCITGFPVYGLVTTGLHGTIMMAWSSQEQSGTTSEVLKPGGAKRHTYNVLMDSYLVSFDLTIPLEAYRFMLAAHRIYLHGLQLQERVKKLDLEDILKQPEFDHWAMPPKSKSKESHIPIADSQSLISF